MLDKDFITFVFKDVSQLLIDCNITKEKPWVDVYAIAKKIGLVIKKFPCLDLGHACLDEFELYVKDEDSREEKRSSIAWGIACIRLSEYAKQYGCTNEHFAYYANALLMPSDIFCFIIHQDDSTIASLCGVPVENVSKRKEEIRLELDVLDNDVLAIDKSPILSFDEVDNYLSTLSLRDI